MIFLVQQVILDWAQVLQTILNLSHFEIAVKLIFVLHVQVAIYNLDMLDVLTSTSKCKCFLFIIIFIRCAINNGNCSIGNICINTNGSFTCGGCRSGYSGTPCTKPVYTGTIRIRIVNSHTNELLTSALSSPFGGSTRIDTYNVTNANWVLSPLPYQLVNIAATVFGNISITMRPGSLTFLSWLPLGGSPFNGYGRQNVNYTAGDDFFLTLYIVPRNSWNKTDTRVTVLTWQSLGTGIFNFVCL